MSKVTRTWSGPSMHAIAGMFYARASVTPKRVLRSLRTQKVLTTVRQIARATPGAPRTARPSKGTISSVTRAWSGMRLVSSSRKNRSILEDAVRQAYSPDSFSVMCTITTAFLTRNDSRVSEMRTRQYAARAICTASCDLASDFAAKRIHLGSCD